MRHTRAHTKNRRSHHGLEKPTLTTNEKGVSHIRHRASSVTGTYKGRQVVDVDAQLAKKEAKWQAKAKERGGEPQSEDQKEEK
jgi:ribosomal protein L32